MHKFLLLLAAVVVASVSNVAKADVVIFQENFSANGANWATNNAAVPATWVNTGGADGGGYISASQNFNAVMFRANAALNASGGGFTGNWLTKGVDHFNIAIRNDSAATQSFSLRFASGTPGFAASTTNFTVASNAWTNISVPIFDSLSSVDPGIIKFVSYEAGGNTGFNTIFSNITNIQLSIAGLPAGSPPVSVGVDSVSITAVPEPATTAALALAMTGGVAARVRKSRWFQNRKSNKS